MMSILALAPTLSAAARASPRELSNEQLLARRGVHNLYFAYNDGDWRAVESAFANTKDVYWTPDLQFRDRVQFLAQLKADWQFGKRYMLMEDSVWLPSLGIAIATPRVFHAQEKMGPLFASTADLHAFRYEFPKETATEPMFTRLRIIETI